MTVELHLGNCLELLRAMPDKSVDAVVTDPPYGVNGGRGGQQREYHKSNYVGGWDDTPEYVAEVCVAAIIECRRIAKAVVLTPGNQSCFLYPKPDDMGCFWQPAAPRLGRWGFSVMQPILYYGWDWRGGKGPLPSGTTMNEAAEKNGHPCPKPIRAWTWLVDKACRPGGTVLDPFMGSGTTAVACIKTGRNFIGIEIEPEYLAIAQKRIAEAQAQLSLPL